MLDISCAAGYPDDREDVGSIMVWIRRLQPFGSPHEQRHFLGVHIYHQFSFHTVDS
jgi:hypothetical protein